MASKRFKVSNNKNIENSGSKANKTVVNLSKKLKNNKSKNLMHIPNIEAIKKPIFLIFNTKKAFNYLKLVFIKVSIFWNFNLKCHIQININALSYIIDKMLS